MRLSSMTEAEKIRLTRALTPRLTKYTKIGLKNKRQIVFLLLLDVLEVLFGGAAGGGKSIGLLAASSQFFDVPGYSALILRRRYRDLALPGALMSVSKLWWNNTDAHWSEKNGNWTFPSGATLQFGYLEHEGDEEQYQSAAFQFVGVDELTQFSEKQYTYMFSRLRRPDDVERFPQLKSVPLRMRAATNPGNKGHAWVKKRWGIKMVKGEAIGTNTRSRVFIQSKLDDNEYLDKESYEKSLEQLSAVTRQQLRAGDWSAVATGGIFDITAPSIVPDLPDRRHWKGIVRQWDFASQRPTEEEPDPDYSAGLKMVKVMMPPPSIVAQAQEKFITLPPPPYWIVMDVVRGQKEPDQVEEMVSGAAHRDGVMVPISIEQERGASGKQTLASYRLHVVPGFRVIRLWNVGDKLTRAADVAAMFNKGRVFLLEGPWIEAFLDELGVFNGKAGQAHDDQVDALSGAYIQLEKLEVMDSNDTQVTQH
jgi:predicted phage terminase large subunit-like protein